MKKLKVQTKNISLKSTKKRGNFHKEILSEFPLTGSNLYSLIGFGHTN